jgi:hypothetical protein
MHSSRESRGIIEANVSSQALIAVKGRVPPERYVYSFFDE